MTSLKFNLNDKVFAKMRGWAPWPAKIDGIADPKPKKGKYHIYFYGTKQTAICKEEELFPYLKYKEKYGKLKKNEEFNKAMKEIEEDRGFDCVSKPRASLNIVSEIDTGKKDLLLTSLLTEKMLLEIQYLVQCSLTTKKADPDVCLKCLDELNDLKLNSLILKKHPTVVEFLVELQNYIGNVDEWDMSPEEIENFETKAAMIRLKALKAHHKIQSLFYVPHGVRFSEVFSYELRKFKSATHTMTDEEVYLLVKDPSAEA